MLIRDVCIALVALFLLLSPSIAGTAVCPGSTGWTNAVSQTLLPPSSSGSYKYTAIQPTSFVLYCQVISHCQLGGMNVLVTVVPSDGMSPPSTQTIQWQFTSSGGSFPPVTLMVGDSLIVQWKGGFHGLASLTLPATHPPPNDQSPPPSPSPSPAIIPDSPPPGVDSPPPHPPPKPRKLHPPSPPPRLVLSPPPPPPPKPFKFYNCSLVPDINITSDATGSTNITFFNSSSAMIDIDIQNITNMTEAWIYAGGMGMNDTQILLALDFTSEPYTGNLHANATFNPNLDFLWFMLSQGVAYLNITTLANPSGELLGDFAAVDL